MDIIPSIPSKVLTKYTIFANNLLIVGAYYKLPRLYVTENITAEEVMDKLEMFQSIFGKIDKFGWWDLEQIQTGAGTHFTSQ